MKKLIVLASILCLAATCLAVTPTQQKAAREAMETAHGTGGGGGSGSVKDAVSTWAGEVTSTKRSLNQVVIKDSKTHLQKTFVVTPDILKSVKLGDEVEVKYRDGSKTVESITVK